VLHWHQVPISSRKRDNGPQIYLGHDLDLSGSRELITHMTIRIRLYHFLLVFHWTQVSISNGFRDIVPQTSSQCSTLVRNTVVRATFKVNGKPPILGSRSPLTP